MLNVGRAVADAIACRQFWMHAIRPKVVGTITSTIPTTRIRLLLQGLQAGRPSNRKYRHEALATRPLQRGMLELMLAGYLSSLSRHHVLPTLGAVLKANDCQQPHRPL